MSAVRSDRSICSVEVNSDDLMKDEIKVDLGLTFCPKIKIITLFYVSPVVVVVFLSPCQLTIKKQHTITNNYTVSGKRCHFIFDYNSPISSWIFIDFTPLKTGMNTP